MFESQVGLLLPTLPPPLSSQLTELCKPGLPGTTKIKGRIYPSVVSKKAKFSKKKLANVVGQNFRILEKDETLH